MHYIFSGDGLPKWRLIMSWPYWSPSKTLTYLHSQHGPGELFSSQNIIRRVKAFCGSSIVIGHTHTQRTIISHLTPETPCHPPPCPDWGQEEISHLAGNGGICWWRWGRKASTWSCCQRVCVKRLAFVACQASENHAEERENIYMKWTSQAGWKL